jgi:hypothetical protein
MWHTKGPGYMMDHFKGVFIWLELAERFDVIERTGRARTSCPQPVGKKPA